MATSLEWRNLPDCCKDCKHRDYDSRDEYSPTYNYCALNLILPTKRGECKRKQPGNDA